MAETYRQLRALAYEEAVTALADYLPEGTRLTEMSDEAIRAWERDWLPRGLALGPSYQGNFPWENIRRNYRKSVDRFEVAIWQAGYGGWAWHVLPMTRAAWTMLKGSLPPPIL